MYVHMYRYAYIGVHVDMHMQTQTHADTHEQQEYTHACTRTQRHTQILARLMHTPQGAGSTGSSRTNHTSATKEMNGLKCSQVSHFQTCRINHRAY